MLKARIFVGYSQNPTAYRLRDPNCPKKLIESRDVVFLEDRFHSTDQSTESVVSLNQMVYAYPEEEITREKLDLEDESDSFQSINSDVQEENHLV